MVYKFPLARATMSDDVNKNVKLGDWYDQSRGNRRPNDGSTNTDKEYPEASLTPKPKSFSAMEIPATSYVTETDRVHDVPPLEEDVTKETEEHPNLMIV